MFAAERLRETLRLPMAVLASAAGWLLIAPWAALVPKRRDWIAVIGRQDGKFLDNSKYFFLQAAESSPGLRTVFVTELAEVTATITRHGLESLHYPGLKTAWFLCRCGTIVVDESNWFRRMRRFLLIRARIVQLWHGIGCKRIELDRWRHETGTTAWASGNTAVNLRLLLYRVTGRWIRFAAVVCTSVFYRDEVFQPAIRARHFPVLGYPRNDFANSLQKYRALAWSNVDAAIAASLPAWQKHQRKLVLIAPTFRDSGSVPMQLDVATAKTVDAFAETHGVEFLFKFHPSERNADHVAGRHFHICTRDADIYPLFPYLSALITDYSSIGMDFLLVDKPLLFLIPPGDDYEKRDRQLQFDPRTMMPGPIVPDWQTLLTAMAAQWVQDNHADARAALKQKAFDNLPQSAAVPGLLGFMQNHGWVKPAHTR